MRMKEIVFLIPAISILATFAASETFRSDTSSVDISVDPVETSEDSISENSETHEDADDYTEDIAGAVQIKLDVTAITVAGTGATVDGSMLVHIQNVNGDEILTFELNIMNNRLTRFC